MTVCVWIRISPSRQSHLLDNLTYTISPPVQSHLLDLPSCRVLSKLGADGDRESEEEEERVRGLGEGERREMAEAAKLEGNTLFAAQKVN